MLILRSLSTRTGVCRPSVTPGFIESGQWAAVNSYSMNASTERESPHSLPSEVIEKLRAAIGGKHVLTNPDELLVYEADALTLHKHIPCAVVIPGTPEEVAAVVTILADAQIPFAPRGAGTGLSGGALALQGAVILELARLNKILKIDYENRIAVVETGVINVHLSQATAPHGYHYAPDPSSQMACTIGGNVAENSGGPHCLKYGMTTNHVLALEVVLPNGEIVTLGGAGVDIPGYDLLGVFVGSEGSTTVSHSKCGRSMNVFVTRLLRQSQVQLPSDER